MSTQDEDELRELVDAELGGFVLWTDDTPHSDEPTELSYFIKGFESGHEIWHRFVTEVVEMILRRDQAINKQAMEKSRSFCGCLMCGHHSSAYALHTTNNSLEEK